MKEIKWDLEKALELKSQGLRYYQIAKELGVSKNSICCYFHKRFGKLPKVISEKRGDIKINQEQLEIIFGTLMGDGNLRYNDSKINVFGRMNHCRKQLDYILYKQQLLYNLTSQVKEYKVKAKGKEYKSNYFCFKSNCNLNPIYHMFYTNGVKDVPLDLTLLTPRAMAFWFMDDGSVDNPSIKIATCSFSLNGLERLKKFLKETYDINVTITKEKRLYFKSESARKFKSLILPYMIESMMYKLKYVKDEK